MSTLEIKQVEQELEALQSDEQRLKELRAKYEGDFTEAEAQWRASRAQDDLDNMVRTKSLLDTVKTALLDQAKEVAKAEAYLGAVHEGHRVDTGITRVVDGELSRLRTLQEDFGSRLAALQAHTTEELLALDAMRVEWDGLHRSGWQALTGLGLTVEQAQVRLRNRDVDATPLRLRMMPTHGELDRRFETPYKLPLKWMPEGTDTRSSTEASVAHTIGVLLHSAAAERERQAYRREEAERASQREQRRNQWAKGGNS